MKREKGKAKKTYGVLAFNPVIGRANEDELVIMRGLNRLEAQIGEMVRAVTHLACKRNVIDENTGALVIDLDNGEIRRQA